MFASQPLSEHNGDASAVPFETWAEVMISELSDLVGEQRAEIATLRIRLARLERSAGRGLIHPSDLIEEANQP